MRIVDGIPVWGEPDPGALQQIRRCAQVAQRVALMADNQLGYGVPIGGVMGMVEAISPTGVGYDIGCGNKAVRLDLTRRDLQQPLGWGVETAMDLIWENLSFGIGRRNDERVDHELFDDPAWQYGPVRRLRDRAADQLGTIGAGNHYVDLLADEQDRVWVGVHFGSRGFGHGIATAYLAAAGGQDGYHVDPVVLPVRGELGGEYLEAMRLAGRYASAGRDWVCDKVAQLLGVPIVEEVHNHHNFAWLEPHRLDSQTVAELWVVRKGATPAFPGQRGFVGGSMGDISVILEGVENDLAEHSLYSTVHGAGRVMSRTAAAGKVRRRWVRDPEAQGELDGLTGRVRNLPRGSAERRAAGERIRALTDDRTRGSWETTVEREGAISREMMAEWLRRERVVLRGANLEEAPQCYRRLPDVLAAHHGTIRVLHYLRPLGVAMAGPDVVDPFKD